MFLNHCNHFKTGFTCLVVTYGPIHPVMAIKEPELEPEGEPAVYPDLKETLRNTIRDGALFIRWSLCLFEAIRHLQSRFYILFLLNASYYTHISFVNKCCKLYSLLRHRWIFTYLWKQILARSSARHHQTELLK